MKFPERYRVQHPLYKSNKYDNFGMFSIPHPNIAFYYYHIIASSGNEEIPWQHVSVTLQMRNGKSVAPVKRTATWAEMCFIKDQFWNDDEVVIQIHPRKADYSSTHAYCLHLWKHNFIKQETPPTEAVGYKSNESH